jgi:hypothetical protein
MADPKSAAGMPLPEAMAGNFQEAARWFTQLWSSGMDPGAAGRIPGQTIPSMMVPTLDIKELDKRIADLRSVEQWLQLNQNLLRTTIQGLEMQRSTLAAWQSLASSPAGAPAAPGGAGTPDVPQFPAAQWWAALQQQFMQMATSAAATEAGAKPPAPGAPGESAPGATAGKPKAPGPAKT